MKKNSLQLIKLKDLINKNNQSSKSLSFIDTLDDINKIIKSILPLNLAQVHAGAFDQKSIVLFAPTSSIAFETKQFLEEILNKLNYLGFEFENISVKIKFINNKPLSNSPIKFW